MNKHIAWYLVELESNLKGKMPEGQLRERLAEVESHLIESTLAIQELEPENPDPGLEAVKMLGSPAQLLEQQVEPPFLSHYNIPKAIQGLFRLPSLMTLATSFIYLCPFLLKGLPLDIQQIMVMPLFVAMNLIVFLLAFLHKRLPVIPLLMVNLIGILAINSLISIEVPYTLIESTSAYTMYTTQSFKIFRFDLCPLVLMSAFLGAWFGRVLSRYSRKKIHWA